MSREERIEDAWQLVMFLMDNAVREGLAGYAPDWRSVNVAFDAYDALTQEAL